MGILSLSRYVNTDHIRVEKFVPSGPSAWPPTAALQIPIHEPDCAILFIAKEEL